MRYNAQRLTLGPGTPLLNALTSLVPYPLLAVRVDDPEYEIGMNDAMFGWICAAIVVVLLAAALKLLLFRK